MNKILFCLFFILVFENDLQAQHNTIQTDRPDQTESTSIVPKKYLQIESGFLFEKTSDVLKKSLHPTILYKYGINDNFELRLITDFETEKFNNKSNSGLSPVMIGFKAKLMEESGCIPATSFIGHLSLPKIASKEFQTESPAPEFRLAMQNTLSDKLTLNYNVGAEWHGETAEPTFIYTLSSNYSITKNIGSFVEFYGFAPQKDKADHSFDAGLTYLITPDSQLDVSGGFGLSDNAPKYFVGFGYSFRIKSR